MTEKFDMKKALFVANNGDLMHTTKMLYAAINRIKELEITANSRYADLQQICNDQDAYLSRMERFALSIALEAGWSLIEAQNAVTKIKTKPNGFL